MLPSCPAAIARASAFLAALAMRRWAALPVFKNICPAPIFMKGRVPAFFAGTLRTAHEVNNAHRLHLSATAGGGWRV